MSKEGGNFFENHIEKIVLVIVGLVCMWLFATRVLVSPNYVEYDGRKFGTGDIDTYISKYAEDLSYKLNLEPEPKAAYESQLDNYAWFDKNSGGKTHPVGHKKPNSWGLYDMHGNVWEWVSDWYDGSYYGKSPSKDPAGYPGGSRRVARGGGWGYYARLCRSAFRSGESPSLADYSIGFRLVREE